MSGWTEWLRLPALAARQRREIKRLREENQTLRAQNDSMREGMRRCVTCDYRIDYKQRQSVAADRRVSTNNQ